MIITMQIYIEMFKRTTMSLCILGLLAGCSSLSELKTRGPAEKLAELDEQTYTRPLREPKPVAEVAAKVATGNDDIVSTSLERIEPPKISIREASQKAEKSFLPKLKETNIERQTYNNMPVSAFINEVYGNQLALNFVIQPSINEVNDLVTLRIAAPISQKDFYALVTKTLENYGITTFEKNGTLVFDYSISVANDVPLLATGEALPEIPSSNRPVFQIYPLEFVKPALVRSTVYQMFQKQDLSITEDIQRNALILRGKTNVVSQASSVIKALDKPSLVDMNSVILRPNVNSALELSIQLESILKTEGINAGRGNSIYPVRFLPLEASEQLIVFSASEEVLNYVVDWAEKLEVQRQTGLENGLFSYQVKSTQASHIVNILNELGASVIQSAAGGSGKPQRSVGSNKFVVDEQLNTVLFSGSGQTWATALDLIKKLDKPAPSVMIEVILAEVSLEESDTSAIEWFRNSSLGAFSIDAQAGGFGSTTGPGLSLSLSRGSQTNAAINFLYTNSKTKIRSRPRLMVKSGQQASIDVGSRVPVITSNSQSSSAPGAPIVQQVTYLSTGVLLDIKPTVHATGYVDIEISQEISEAVNSTSGGINSPTISNRSVETVLTLRDGGSVLIGGLIRSTDGEGETGIPLLGKLPGLGKLFRGDNSSDSRTELMVMIIPYILNSPQEAELLSDDLQKARLKLVDEY